MREAAKLQDPVARAAVELMKLHNDAAKESLVNAVGDDILRTQGSARTLGKIHSDLTTDPPKIVNPET